MLQQRGYYTIILGDGTKIPLRFCTWSFKRFCEINDNMSLSQLQESLSKNGMTISSFVSLLLCAAEYVCVKEKKEFPYTDIDASDWIDEMGGIVSAEFLALLKLILETFYDGSANDKEKKIPVKQKS